jgi:hypothetical protein
MGRTWSKHELIVRSSIPMEHSTTTSSLGVRSTAHREHPISAVYNTPGIISFTYLASLWNSYDSFWQWSD